MHDALGSKNDCENGLNIMMDDMTMLGEMCAKDNTNIIKIKTEIVLYVWDLQNWANIILLTALNF